MNSSTESSDDQFGNRDQNSPDTLIPDTQNLLEPLAQYISPQRGPYLLAIANDDVVHIFTRAKVRKILLDLVLIPDGQKAPLWFSEKPGIVLDGIALGRGIDDAEHFLQMGLKELYL